jgi:hypothetical protein
MSWLRSTFRSGSRGPSSSAGRAPAPSGANGAGSAPAQAVAPAPAPAPSGGGGGGTRTIDYPAPQATRGAWADFPPLHVLHGPPVLVDWHFDSRLASWQNPIFGLKPLGHLRTMDAPSGTVFVQPMESVAAPESHAPVAEAPRAVAPQLPELPLQMAPPEPPPVVPSRPVAAVAPPVVVDDEVWSLPSWTSPYVDPDPSFVDTMVAPPAELRSVARHEQDEMVVAPPVADGSLRLLGAGEEIVINALRTRLTGTVEERGPEPEHAEAALPLVAPPPAAPAAPEQVVLPSFLTGERALSQLSTPGLEPEPPVAEPVRRRGRLGDPVMHDESGAPLPLADPQPYQAPQYVPPPEPLTADAPIQVVAERVAPSYQAPHTDADADAPLPLAEPQPYQAPQYVAPAQAPAPAAEAPTQVAAESYQAPQYVAPSEAAQVSPAEAPTQLTAESETQLYQAPQYVPPAEAVTGEEFAPVIGESAPLAAPAPSHLGEADLLVDQPMALQTSEQPLELVTHPVPAVAPEAPAAPELQHHEAVAAEGDYYEADYSDYSEQVSDGPILYEAEPTAVLGEPSPIEAAPQVAAAAPAVEVSPATSEAPLTLARPPAPAAEPARPLASPPAPPAVTAPSDSVAPLVWERPTVATPRSAVEPAPPAAPPVSSAPAAAPPATAQPDAPLPLPLAASRTEPSAGTLRLPTPPAIEPPPATEPPSAPVTQATASVSPPQPAPETTATAPSATVRADAPVPQASAAPAVTQAQVSQPQTTAPILSATQLPGSAPGSLLPPTHAPQRPAAAPDAQLPLVGGPRARSEVPRPSAAPTAPTGEAPQARAPEAALLLAATPPSRPDTPAAPTATSAPASGTAAPAAPVAEAPAADATPAVQRPAAAPDPTAPSVASAPPAPAVAGTQVTPIVPASESLLRTAPGAPSAVPAPAAPSAAPRATEGPAPEMPLASGTTRTSASPPQRADGPRAEMPLARTAPATQPTASATSSTAPSAPAQSFEAPAAPAVEQAPVVAQPSAPAAEAAGPAEVSAPVAAGPAEVSAPVAAAPAEVSAPVAAAPAADVPPPSGPGSAPVSVAPVLGERLLGERFEALSVQEPALPAMRADVPVSGLADLPLMLQARQASASASPSATATATATIAPPAPPLEERSTMAPLVGDRSLALQIQPTTPPDAGPLGPRDAPAVHAMPDPTITVRAGRNVDAAARDMQARAFTHDGEVHLPSSTLARGPAEVEPLLAHEMTHVMQQRILGPHALPVESSLAGQALEAEAQAAEFAVRETRQFQIPTTSPVASDLARSASLPLVELPLFPAFSAFQALQTEGRSPYAGPFDPSAAHAPFQIEAPPPPPPVSAVAPPAVQIVNQEETITWTSPWALAQRAPEDGNGSSGSDDDSGGGGGGGEEISEVDIADRIYPLIEARLRGELRRHRDRSGRVTDFDL